jgi:alcohol dehydrogenase class IV
MFRAKHIWYRTFQFFFYKAARLIKWPAPVLLKGEGSVLKLPEEMQKRGIVRALFVTDRSLLALRLPGALLDALKDAGSAPPYSTK